MKRLLIYLIRMFNDKNGLPSARRYACALFGFTAILLAFCGYNTELVALFVEAAFGENIINLLKRGSKHEK